MTTLTADQLDTLENAAYDAGGEIRSYSGRAMFGTTCLGLDVESITTLARFFVSLAANDLDLATRLTNNVRTDSMGMGMIAYWPAFSFGDDEDEG